MAKMPLLATSIIDPVAAIAELQRTGVDFSSVGIGIGGRKHLIPLPILVSVPELARKRSFVAEDARKGERVGLGIDYADEVRKKKGTTARLFAPAWNVPAKLTDPDPPLPNTPNFTVVDQSWFAPLIVTEFATAPALSATRHEA
jgi:hypothetical protein